MPEETTFARCAVCGKTAPRDDMFGAAPELLCEACAQGVRERMRPAATGRMMNAWVSGRSPVTASLLGIVAVLFVCSHLVFGTETRPWPAWLWLFPTYGPTGNVATGQTWRLVTSALLHGGWIHVIFNSLWIWSLGRAVEMTRGLVVYAFLLVGSAAFSSAAQWYFGVRLIPGSWVVYGGGIGMSGVLYGLAGYLWMRRREDPVAATVLSPYVARILGAWFVICILMPSLNVANWAHGGGLAWGLAAGWASVQKQPRVAYAGLAAATIAAAAWVATGHLAH